MTFTFLAVLKISMVCIGEYTFRIKFVFLMKLSLEFVIRYDVMMVLCYLTLNSSQNLI